MKIKNSLLEILSTLLKFNFKFSIKFRIKFLIIFLLISTLQSCGGNNTSETEDPVRALQCPSVEKNYSFDEIAYNGGKSTGQTSYSELKDKINSSCTSCHQAPAQSGGFTYIDSYKGEIRTIAGKTQFYPGFFEIAEQISAALSHPDESKIMPPEDRRKNNPEYFVQLTSEINTWIILGKPNGSFNLNTTTLSTTPQKPQFRNSQFGNCVPSPDIIGFDYAKDKQFSLMQKLPNDLSDTDIVSLDALELAKKGTLAYNVEYPLWADNNSKGRWIHLPMEINGNKADGFQLKRKAIQYLENKNYFDVPENTRLYKFFYKKIKMGNGKYRFKRVETRIIVVRKPWNKSLFGTYKWDENEQSATLVQTPYRDGSGFKDTSVDITVDEIEKKIRKYPIPGSQRCIECHMGSEGQNFILGLTPIQLNRRAKDNFLFNLSFKKEDHEDTLTLAESGQIERFKKYGLFENAPDQTKWKTLEESGLSQAKNEFELKASGYMYGNCAHCHNPNGLAFSKENAVTLDLTPGSIFSFNTKTRSTQIASRLLVHQNGDLDQSHIWRKFTDSSQQLGLTSQMPMNTAATPDCQGMRLIGKWIKSFESEDAAKSFEPLCKKENDLKWIDQDFTIVKSDYYIPRRPDWNDATVGMPDKFKNRPLTEELNSAMHEPIAVGFWNKKEQCQFPEKTLKPEELRPWMLKGPSTNPIPKRPFGEIYYSTPGAWYYKTSCLKCHGENADGNTALAKGILQWSGGNVRVANLVDGMFGKKNENLKTFDYQGKNFAPQYLFWMAMEGTRVQFPSELSSFVGKHGAQMLNQLKEKCLNQISTKKTSTPQFMDHEIFKKICFTNNLKPGHPDISFNPETNKAIYPEKVDAWLDQAAFNIGYSIFEYLKDLSLSVPHPSNDQCELIYPKKEGL